MHRDNNVKLDYFGINSSFLVSKKLWLFDMDGTIYRDNIVFDGTIDLMRWIKVSGGRYVFITNNSSKSVSEYVIKVTNLGIEANEENFFTSTQATILYLKAYYPNQVVYSMGTQSFIHELQQSGINVVTNLHPDIQVVLIGFDTELTTEKIRKTCELLTKDIPYIATNPDLACPVSFGYIPDCGAISKLIECATGKLPIFIGKPNSRMVEFVINKFGNNITETVVVGDRLYTDIATGVNAKVTTVCVLTGEATADDICNGIIKPTFTFKDVGDIFNILKQSLDSMQS